MKVGTIAKTNHKGQIVIPKEMRDDLGIGFNMPLNLIARGAGIYIYPIKEVIGVVDNEDSYMKILEKTKGAWANDNWDKTRMKRRKIELKSSQSRKKVW